MEWLGYWLRGEGSYLLTLMQLEAKKRLHMHLTPPK